MNIDILLDKGLHAVAKQELNEAKDAFLKSGFPVERLLLLRRESLLQYYENYKFASIADIEQVYNHRILAAEQLVLEVKLARILSLLSYYYHSGSQKIEEIFKIQNEFLQSDYSEAREFSTQYLYCWIQAQIEEFKGNPAGSFLYFEKTMSLWFDNQIYIDAHPRMYLGTCFTYLKYMLQQKSLNSDLLARVNFDELLNKLNSSNLSTENVLQYAQIFNATKFLRLCINQKFEQVNATIGPVLHKFFREDQATDFYQIMISFLAAVAAFESDDFKKAEKYIQRVYPSQTIDISKNPEYEYDVLLLHLIIQFELGNMRYLKLQLEYCKNYINSKDKKEGIENLLFELLGKLISKRYQDNKRLVLDRYKNRMNEIAAANKLSSQFKHNVYMNWIERNLRKSL